MGVSRRLLSLPPCLLFCSVGCPGGWPNLLGSSAVARLAAVYGGRSPRLKIKARVALSRAQPPAVGDFLTLFSLPPRRLCRGWLEYLEEVVAVVASGRFSASPALWGPRLAGAGACLSSFTPFQLVVSMGVGLRRLHAPTGFCAIGAVLVAASFCVGYLDSLSHGLGPWCR